MKIIKETIDMYSLKYAIRKIIPKKGDRNDINLIIAKNLYWNIIRISVLSISSLADINNWNRENEFTEREIAKKNIDIIISTCDAKLTAAVLTLSNPIKKVAEISERDADDIK